MLEKTVEAYLVERVRALGGGAYKFTSPARASVPDRIVVLPPGRVYFIEVKRPGGKPTRAQEREHERLRALGADVRVLDSIGAINAFLTAPTPAPVAVLPEEPTGELLSIIGGYPWRLQGNANKQDIAARYAELRRVLLADVPTAATTCCRQTPCARPGLGPCEMPASRSAKPLTRCAAAPADARIGSLTAAEGKDALDTLVAVLNAIGYTEEFAEAHPDMKVSEGVAMLLRERAAPAEPADQHSDDAAIDAFAAEMKAKMASSRAKGRGGWETCAPADLSRMLREHVEKGDPRDVANFCMMLWHHRAAIKAER